MVLGGLAPEVQKLALTLTRPGMAIVQDGQDWHYARCSDPTNPEIRALAATHVDKRIGWDDLILADRAAADAHQRAHQESVR